MVSNLLLPLSWFYCLLVFFRCRCYQFGLLPRRQIPVPVIVVGNITVGGTGKTPVVIWLARFLAASGYCPGIVSRGYRGKSSHYPLVVNADVSPFEAGDEPVLLARHGACPVIVDPERVRAAQLLVDQYQCTVIIADDGMQHYALARDIEIAVIDGCRRFGNGRCLPAGPLREPVSRLEEVDITITNGTPEHDELSVTLAPTGFINLGNANRRVDGSFFHGDPVHAVAGIGNPDRFFDLLEKAGIDVRRHAFDDHHAFVPKDLTFADDKNIIMTEKDAVKCQQFDSLLKIAPDRYWYLAVEAQPDDQFGHKILKLLSERQENG